MFVSFIDILTGRSERYYRDSLVIAAIYITQMHKGGYGFMILDLLAVYVDIR